MPQDDGMVRYFQNEKEKHLRAAKEITQSAKDEARGLTSEENSSVSSHMEAARDFHQKTEDMVENQRRDDEIEKLGAGLSGTPEIVSGNPRDIGEAFVMSEAYQSLKARGTSGQFAVGPVFLPPQFGAATVLESTGSNATIIERTRIPGILPPVEAQPVVTDLFGQGVVAGNTVALASETVTTNAADTVAEGGAKLGSTIQFAATTKTLVKTATSIKVSTEMLEDEPAVRSYLSNRLGQFVAQKEEDVVIAALLAQAGQVADAFMVGGNNVFDSILAGMVKVQKFGGLEPDAVIMSPMDFATMSVEKESTSGAYFSGGPYGAAGRRLWGTLQVVVSGRLTDGDIVVGAFKQGGTIWRKASGLQVEATNSNEDDFLKNLTAIRAEERLILFLQRASAFCVVSTTS